MKLTFDLEYEQDEIAHYLVAQAAERVAAEAQKQIVADIRATVKEQIADQLATIVTETLENSYQPSDEWGEPKGKPTTLRDQVKEKANAYLAAKVNGEGKETGYQANYTRAEYLVRQIVKEEINYAIKKEIQDAARKAKAEMQKKVAEFVSETMLKG